MNNHPRGNLPEIDFSSDLSNFSSSLLLEKQNQPAAGEKFIVFFLDDELFAVSADQVAEVVRPPEVTPLPRVPEWLFGIANLRGEIIAVVDLAKLLNKRASHVSTKPKLIVLRGPNANASIAFKVDKLSEMTTLSEDEIQFSRATSPYIVGQAVHRTKPLNLLDAQALVSSLKLHG
jgi:purine-binding chemotaxis protein CheW